MLLWLKFGWQVCSDLTVSTLCSSAFLSSTPGEESAKQRCWQRWDQSQAVLKERKIANKEGKLHTNFLPFNRGKNMTLFWWAVGSSHCCSIEKLLYLPLRWDIFEITTKWCMIASVSSVNNDWSLFQLILPWYEISWICRQQEKPKIHLNFCTWGYLGYHSTTVFFVLRNCAVMSLDPYILRLWFLRLWFIWAAFATFIQFSTSWSLAVEYESTEAPNSGDG